jgi:muconolactone delta-isomerase
MPAIFLVVWKLEISRVGPEMMHAVLRQQEYGRSLEERGKLLQRYHIVGGHGGAWIYEVESHEELDHLLAAAPAYNYATYTVYPLARMDKGPTVLAEAQGGSASGSQRAPSEGRAQPKSRSLDER